MNLKVINVTSLNNYIKKLIEGDIILRNVAVEGEISNFKDHTSGHLYFTLKDNLSRVSCVMFRMDRLKLKKIPKDGDKVTLKGRVSVYPQGGNYQIYVESIEFTDLTGDLFLRFNEIKEKLSKAGLFNEELKRPICESPRKIAVVTSPTGAAVRDIIRVMKSRNPSQELLIYPSLVQGENSTKEIILAIKRINFREDVDTIILARGGGSIEDLWAFNSEELAYVIRESKIPIVTGIGHEIDFTIADFAADKRCATPSQAAEIAIPSVMGRIRDIENIERKMKLLIMERLKREKQVILFMERFIKNKDPKVNLINEIKYISDLEEGLKKTMDQRFKEEKRRMTSYLALLNAFNPYSVLEKGYSIVMDEAGHVLKSIEEIDRNNIFRLRVSNGETIIKRY